MTAVGIGGLLERKMCLPTAYFFPGGRGRPPCWNEATYSLFLAIKLCWTGVAISDELTCNYFMMNE